jgi:hypothetical protein
MAKSQPSHPTRARVLLLKDSQQAKHSVGVEEAFCEATIMSWAGAEAASFSWSKTTFSVKLIAIFDLSCELISIKKAN